MNAIVNCLAAIVLAAISKFHTVVHTWLQSRFWLQVVLHAPAAMCDSGAHAYAAVYAIAQCCAHVRHQRWLTFR